MPSRRSVARVLEIVEDFTEPSLEREQYLTPPELAAHVCHLAAVQGDLDGARIVDLGTGTGMLAIGAALYAPSGVVGLDLDRSALQLARRNSSRVRRAVTGGGDTLSPIELLQGDVARHPLTLTDATVVSNPPFGAVSGRRHTDRTFLETARSIGRVSYTIHNAGSKSFVESFAVDNGGEVTHAFSAPFPIPNRFAHHTADERTIETQVFRIEW